MSFEKNYTLLQQCCCSLYLSELKSRVGSIRKLNFLQGDRIKLTCKQYEVHFIIVTNTCLFIPGKNPQLLSANHSQVTGHYPLINAQFHINYAYSDNKWSFTCDLERGISIRNVYDLVNAIHIHQSNSLQWGFNF